MKENSRAAALPGRKRRPPPTLVVRCCGADLLFTVSDNGVAKCYDADTGHQKWKKRLPGDYKALADCSGRPDLLSQHARSGDGHLRQRPL